MARMKSEKKYQQKKVLGQGLFGLSLLFLLLGLMILGWGVWPGSSDSRQLTIPAGILPAAPEGTAYASQAEYTLTIDWPIWLRKGEQADLQATLVETDGTALADRSAQVVLLSRCSQANPGAARTGAGQSFGRPSPGGELGDQCFR